MQPRNIASALPLFLIQMYKKNCGVHESKQLMIPRRVRFFALSPGIGTIQKTRSVCKDLFFFFLFLFSLGRASYPASGEWNSHFSFNTLAGIQHSPFPPPYDNNKFSFVVLLQPPATGTTPNPQGKLESLSHKSEGQEGTLHLGLIAHAFKELQNMLHIC